MCTLELSVCGAFWCGAVLLGMAALAEAGRRRLAGNWPWRLLAVWAARRMAIGWRKARRRFRVRGVALGRWRLPAAGALLVVLGWLLMGRGERTELLAEPAEIAVSTAEIAARAAVPGEATTTVVAEKPARSEFEEIMQQRAARNLRLLEFGGLAAVIVTALCALAYRFGSA